MTIESIAIALHHSHSKGTAKLVLIGIANHDGDGGAWPAVATLAKYAGVDRRNVQRAIDTLESLGEIKRIRGAGGNHETAEHRRPNLYRFLLTCPPNCDRSAHHRTPRQAAVLDILTPDGAALAPPVADSLPGDASATGGGGADAALTNLLTEEQVKERNPAYRAREGNTDALSRDDHRPANAMDGLCEKGHPIIAISGGGLPICAMGDYGTVRAS